MRTALRRFAWLLPLAALLAVGAGCREIPPRRTDAAAAAELSPGSMPEAVYHPEPLHPANRWRRRAAALRRAEEEAPRGSSEGAGSAGGDGDPPATRPLEPADRAELIALLEQMEREMAGVARDPSAASSLGRDLAAEKEALEGEGADRDLLEAYDRALRALAAQAPAGPLGG
ncbi:MAG: hypothetical protein JXA90_03585 [Planctomycetes bacterium]|nr:hypothetical protein [Planctomycetota bacterium]